MTVREAGFEDLPALRRVYKAAKAYMAGHGNAGQWGENYPEALLEADLEARRLYAVCDGTGAVHGCFVFSLGEEPGYAEIDGAWPDEGPYGVIHRLASDGVLRGVFARCLAFCRALTPVIRADTHENNRTMRRLLESHGFVCCGRVNLDLRDGDTLRLAYQYRPADEKGEN